MTLKAWLPVCMLVPALASAAAGPDAPGRTYASNYKDLVLATCIATAYKQDAAAAGDAVSTVSGLREFTYYDMENSPAPISALVEKYLQRDYRNPVADTESGQTIQFSLLKCLDLYHSKELKDQVKRFVDKPNRTYRQDHPAKK